jgi:catechol 2,3-dioxygenase-like lactoylglutathione lyase family enzyme
MKFDHIAINSQNVKKSVDWYVTNLNSEIVYQDDSWAMIMCNGTKIAIVLEGEHPPHLAFKVSSSLSFPCDQSEIKVHRDSSSYYYGSDPDGNIIEWIVYAEDSE